MHCSVLIALRWASDAEFPRITRITYAIHYTDSIMVLLDKRACLIIVFHHCIGKHKYGQS